MFGTWALLYISTVLQQDQSKQIEARVGQDPLASGSGGWRFADEC